MITAPQVTGLVLAGGRGSRMGGVDKGLQTYRGQPLAQHALRRLAPQVGPLMINANRNIDAYRSFGVPVCSDAQTEFAGPLAGLLSGLDHCATPYLACVACDTPHFPPHLVQRLASALGTADAAMAVTYDGSLRRAQPVFCLVRSRVRDALRHDLAAGARRMEEWLARRSCVDVAFADAEAFHNINTLEELQRMEQGHV